MGLPLKQPSVWGYSCSKNKPDQVFFDDLINISSIVMISSIYIYILIQETDFWCYLKKWKVTSNFSFKLQGNFLVKVSFITY